ncbi:MAG: 3-isopropylmalate dehydratase small subunit [Desulfobulbaceae bacterium]|uniref:3-isopropylmalate dehydratase n=1 Tax=Candidatus Desulfatifera sulfidica TaxID=2841691 RepID=A0A8J6NAV3_9BACT|nr:3-isopropylmalate dehydratase small subunit [Candidatus Desulfatifera sulfidica]
MKTFGGPAIMLDRSDINTDEIIPAKYLTENSKMALKSHMLEDLLLDGHPFDNNAPAVQAAKVVITRANFGCGSSREHAVWVFEVNNINVVIGESFARIFRQNMFNCGILAVELAPQEIDSLFKMQGNLTVSVDIAAGKLTATSDNAAQAPLTCTFDLNPYDRELVAAGGWLAYADLHY